MIIFNEDVTILCIFCVCGENYTHSFFNVLKERLIIFLSNVESSNIFLTRRQTSKFFRFDKRFYRCINLRGIYFQLFVSFISTWSVGHHLQLPLISDSIKFVILYRIYCRLDAHILCDIIKEAARRWPTIYLISLSIYCIFIEVHIVVF
jgi:hypothetical protein